MPATSKKQQQFFGMLHSIKQNKMKNPPASLVALANKIDGGKIKDFSSTKHEGLPTHVTKEAAEIEKVASLMVPGFIKAAMAKGMTQPEAEELLKQAWAPLLAAAARFLPMLGRGAMAAAPAIGRGFSSFGQGIASAGRGIANFMTSPFGKGLSLGSMIPGPGAISSLTQKQTSGAGGPVNQPDPFEQFRQASRPMGTGHVNNQNVASLLS